LKITQFINILLNYYEHGDLKSRWKNEKEKKRQTISNNLNNDKTKTKREVVQCILDIPPKNNM